MKRYGKHDSAVDNLAKRLQATGRYFAVGTEVPMRLPGKSNLHGQADVITVDTRGTTPRMTYWEVKTGFHDACYEKAKKQAQHFYEFMKKSPGDKIYNTNFIYYNPVSGCMKRIKKSDV